MKNKKYLLDESYLFKYNRRRCFSTERLFEGGGFRYEDDISAEEETEIQSTWFQKEDEHC